jgi:hypothetical protein
MLQTDGGGVKEKVYVETSVVSYLCSRPSRDLVVAAMQQMTREWWETHRRRYDCFVSDVVIEEIGHGDKDAAARRQPATAGLAVLAVNDAVVRLADHLMKQSKLPPDREDDVLHVAIATVHGMDYLLTWNCAHIANPHWLKKFDQIIRKQGYAMPLVCTPQALLEGGE